MKKLLVLSALTFLVPSISAQAPDSLLYSYTDVVSRVLKENFSIRLSKNAQVRAENDNTLGNAGFLPTVDVTGSRTTSIEDTDLEFFNGDNLSRTGNETRSMNAAINLNWTVFDGFRMFAERDRLQELSAAGEATFRNQVNNTVADVSILYQQIIRFQESISILEETISVSQQRAQLAEVQLSVGTGSELEVFQSKVDLNADRSALMQQQVEMNRLKAQLLAAMNVDPSTPVVLENYWDDTVIPPFATLLAESYAQNPELLSQTMQERALQDQLRSIRAEYYPRLNVNVGYAYRELNTEAGNFTFLEVKGLTYGVSAQWRIFDGFNVSRRNQNAKIDARTAQLQTEQLLNSVEQTLYESYVAYTQGLELVALEEANFDFANKTLEISLERLKEGTIAAFEFREAQRTWLSARLRLLNARYDTRIHWHELQRLTGAYSGK